MIGKRFSKPMNPRSKRCSRSDKIDYKLQLIRRDRDRYYILTKGKSYQEDVTILNIHESNTREPIKETFTVAKTMYWPSDSDSGNFNTPLLPIDRSPRQKLNR